MAIQLITYDLRAPGKNYAALFAAIENLGPSCRFPQSVWLVDTNLSSVSIAQRLQGHMDTNDQILVVELRGDWAVNNAPGHVIPWLRQHLAP
jgi:hypothetical protein